MLVPEHHLVAHQIYDNIFEVQGSSDWQNQGLGLMMQEQGEPDIEEEKKLETCWPGEDVDNYLGWYLSVA